MPDSFVVQVGPVGADAAECLATRDGRRLLRAPDLDAAADALCAHAAGVAVVAAGLDDHPPEALLRFATTLALRAPGMAAGFLYGRTGPQLLAAARRIAPRAGVVARAAPPPVFAHPDYAGFITGTRVRRAEAELLSAPADMMYILAHSNGHDAGIEGAYICRNAAMRHRVGPERALPCFGDEPCRFAPVPVVSADEIRARVVVGLTCFGVSHPHTPFATESTIGEAMLGGGAVQTLLTMLRASSLEGPDYLTTYYLCNLGLPLGEVAGRANRARLARGRPAELVCFGDPGVRLDRQVAEVHAGDAGHDGYSAVRLPPRAEPVDVLVPLGGAELPPEAVAILRHTGGVSAGVVAPEGVFLTVGASPEEQRVEIAIASRQQLAWGTDARQEMFRDLVQMASYAAALGAAAQPAEAAPCAAALAREVAAARDMLVEWPLEHVRPGRVLLERDLQEVWARGNGALARLGDAALDAFDAFAPSLMPLTVAHQRAVRSGEAPFAHPCAACGQVIAAEAWVHPLTGSRRTYGICLGCGPVFEGDPETAWRLEVPAAAAPGETVRVRAPVRNPFSVPVPVCATAYVGAFRAGTPHRRGRSPRTLLPAGEAGAAELEIPLPADFTTGVHFLVALLTAGTRTVFLRRPLVVLGSPLTQIGVRGAGPRA